MRFVSRSAAQTKRVAAKLAKRLLNVKSDLPTGQAGMRYATVVALSGDLGAGKTTFVQGFAKALGIKHRIVSPTFLIFRRYQASSIKHQVSSIKYRDKIQNFYHVDLYRIHNIKELDVLNFKSILHYPFNIVLIEWGEKIKKLLPKDTIWVNFSHGRKENERFITY